MSLSEAQVRAMVKKELMWSLLVKKLKSKPQHLLITVLVGNNLVNIFSSVYATIVFSRIFNSNAIGITTGIMTVFILIFGEIFPKSLASRYSKTISRLISPIIGICYIIFFPIVILLELLMSLVFRIIGKPNVSHGRTTEDELKAMISITAEHGSIPQHEQELMHNILELDETPVEQLMTPRNEIEMLESTTSIEEASKAYLEHLHSRMPVYEDSKDNIIGILTVQELFEHFSDSRKKKKTIKNIELVKPIFVPETQKAYSLVKTLQKKHTHMALVVDEHGMVSGLVTLEDLLEEIVGDIVDEHDDEESEIKKLNKNTWLIDGSTPIEDVNETLNCQLKAPDHKNISYFILNHLNRLPNKGETMKIGRLELCIEAMKNNSIDKIKITRKKS